MSSIEATDVRPEVAVRKETEASVLREHDAKMTAHALAAAPQADVMRDPSQPLSTRAVAALAAAGHTLASTYHQAARKVDEMVFDDPEVSKLAAQPGPAITTVDPPLPETLRREAQRSSPAEVVTFPPG
jgi:hypothetical protein